MHNLYYDIKGGFQQSIFSTIPREALLAQLLIFAWLAVPEFYMAWSPDWNMARYYKGNNLCGPTQHICTTKSSSEWLL